MFARGFLVSVVKLLSRVQTGIGNPVHLLVAKGLFSRERAVFGKVNLKRGDLTCVRTASISSALNSFLMKS